ncbi:4-hydroxyphenylpyruvate dioxygenase [Longimycelium tulufanense]|uniref:4-hydroxyphenylpyruvate dioxygenase n=1 Tax=Longimycelium tulufanense TaxID=907463 RepID=A0A8J3CBQ5_9PSEU|nr:4-hydroxyphenylpyruvate dioxygenase [Longimycelium tulufanense]GGM50063.1 4-hydroxyphenylpyruvate dioxygenase [Longimycelium tulufanense]
MALSTELGLGHVEFHVANVATTAASLISQYGFRPIGWAGFQGTSRDGYSLALRQGGIDLLLTKGLTDRHPATSYVQTHGGGVADIALSTPDPGAAFTTAVAHGAQPVAGPATGPDGRVTATIAAFGDVVHTFVQPAETGTAVPAGCTPMPDADEPVGPALFTGIDHFAVCLEPGQLEPTVRFYEQVLGFRMIYAERITVGSQAMDSKVVQSESGRVTLTLIEPDTTADPGQIDDFVKDHGGAGVQHVAFGTDNIVRAVGLLRDRGVEFLSTPGAYYDMLDQRLRPAGYDTADLRRLSILVDEDHDGQLFQIFTRSTHPRRTLFYEVVERMGARTFGSGNIRALYEAVEAERVRPAELAG